MQYFEHEIKLCQEGDAHEWYNNITVLPDWDALKDLFCQKFCIFGQSEEVWHEAWQRLVFDRNTDNIDKFINKVKHLAHQLRFHDQSILIKLKQLFPKKTDTWLVVNDLDEMCSYLKRLYSPNNLRQTDPAHLDPQTGSPSATSGGAATPFSNTIHQDAYHLQIRIQEKNVILMKMHSYQIPLTNSLKPCQNSHNSSLGTAVMTDPLALPNCTNPILQEAITEKSATIVAVINTIMVDHAPTLIMTTVIPSVTIIGTICDMISLTDPATCKPRSST